MSLKLLTYFRTKCQQCGIKFTVTNESNCERCNHIGLNCQHGRICSSCLKDKIFYGTSIAIVLVALHTLGVVLR